MRKQDRKLHRWVNNNWKILQLKSNRRKGKRWERMTITRQEAVGSVEE
jgi:hypothetical protein